MLVHYRARRVQDKKAHLGMMGSILYAFAAFALDMLQQQPQHKI
jgi:hypothetical protein